MQPTKDQMNKDALMSKYINHKVAGPAPHPPSNATIIKSVLVSSANVMYGSIDF